MRKLVHFKNVERFCYRIIKHEIENQNNPTRPIEYGVGFYIKLPKTIKIKVSYIIDTINIWDIRIWEH